MSTQGLGHSRAWYLLPIFFALLGGIAMWLATTKQEPDMARKGLYLGIIMTLLPIFIYGGVIALFAF